MITTGSMLTSFSKMKGRDEIEGRLERECKREGDRLQYEPDLIRNGQNMLSTHKQAPAIVPWSSMQPRELQEKSAKSSAFGLNKTMGTTAMSKVSLGSASNKCPTEASVSFVDYLPNSIVGSPQRRAFSHSNVTQRLGINKVVRTNVMV